jgi:hypothetical protein
MADDWRAKGPCASATFRALRLGLHRQRQLHARQGDAHLRSARGFLAKFNEAGRRHGKRFLRMHEKVEAAAIFM